MKPFCFCCFCFFFLKLFFLSDHPPFLFWFPFPPLAFFPGFFAVWCLVLIFFDKVPIFDLPPPRRPFPRCFFCFRVKRPLLNFSFKRPRRPLFSSPFHGYPLSHDLLSSPAGPITSLFFPLAENSKIHSFFPSVFLLPSAGSFSPLKLSTVWFLLGLPLSEPVHP